MEKCIKKLINNFQKQKLRKRTINENFNEKKKN